VQKLSQDFAMGASYVIKLPSEEHSKRDMGGGKVKQSRYRPGVAQRVPGS
jgi:hypothetical protein